MYIFVIFKNNFKSFMGIHVLKENINNGNIESEEMPRYK
jgi:hypothetical protein